MTALADLEVLAAGLDHPEGIALGPDGALYAGGEAGQVYRIDADGAGAEQIADTGGFLLGLCLDGAGAVYVCDTAAQAVLRLDPSGALAPYCEAAGGERLRMPNWAAFAADGALWLSDSGTEDVRVRDGTLLRIPPGGGDAEVADLPPLHFPNGLCVTPAGDVCFLESFTPRLSVLRNGGIEVLAELPGVVPDGVAADAAGGFVVACYYPFSVLAVSPAGTVTTLLDDPLGLELIGPTNAAFYGDGLERLAFSSLLGWNVTAVPAPVPGAPLHYP